jgi:hypothetical protein
MTETQFTSIEVEKLGRLVNNLGILGSQLICRNQSGLGHLAHTNLQNIKKSDEQFLKRLSQLARNSGDESALRLIEDLERIPDDPVRSDDPIQSLYFARGCLFASAFLGHCIAAATKHALAQSALVCEQTRTLN